MVIVAVGCVAGTGFGLKLAVAPDGSPGTGPSVTGPDQFERVTVTVAVVEPPGLVDSVDGLSDSLKLGALVRCSDRVTVAVCVTVPLVALIGAEYVLGGLLPVVLKVNVAVRVLDPAGTMTVNPEVVIAPTVQLDVESGGRFPAVSVTAAVNPFDGVIDTT
jgi:hypothetical protein